MSTEKKNTICDCTDQIIYNKNYFLAFWITLSISITLIILGYFAPPIGHIDNSILVAVGELAIWPAFCFISKYVDSGRVANVKLLNGLINARLGEDKDGDGFDDSKNK